VERDAGGEEVVEPLAIVVVLEDRPSVVAARRDVLQAAVRLAVRSA
jgi:hypothetical protein